MVPFSGTRMLFGDLLMPVVPKGVGVRDGVAGVAVPPCGVIVGVLVDVWVGVGVWVAVGVEVRVLVTVGVGGVVPVALAVGEGVSVGGVSVGVPVAVTESVLVAV
jgi:hypothetical protein